MPADDPLWYKDAIIYELHVKAFYDSSGDGIGDFHGLAEKLDYVHDLGVNAIWLLPFYPSPMRDDGYDIADYRNIHPHYGTRKDFRHFVREAHARGLRVITELVINHTSDQHPWFQAARRAPAGSAKRNFYVWSDTDKKFPETRIIFTDTESSNWAWDPLARQYYWHRFFSHQPDLNHNNPEVVRAVTRVMRFWLDSGVDGLRLDAIPYLCVREGTSNENLPETHAVLKRMRAELDAHYNDRMFLAEANQWPEDVRPYFGDGDECHMAYHFPLMPRMYMALAQEDRHPITEILNQTPDIPDTCQWATFLRNHDELTLEMVTDRERDYMYQAYAADPRMRVNIGIRRRLAPLMENSRDKIELMNTLLMSLIGSPIIYYGDEIGMGENIYLGDRDGVRTPMQWSGDRNAGFSRADPQRLYLPPIMDPVYGYQSVNVEAQSRSPSSLLNWMKRLIAVRKAHPALGRGSLTLLHPGNRKILAYLREHEGESILCVANLSRSPQPVELNLAAYKGRVPVEMMGRTPFPPIGDLPYLLTLPGYGHYWFRLATDVEEPHWHQEFLPPAELPVLVLFEGWRTLFPERLGAADDVRSLLAGKVRTQLERDVLPGFIAAQRWFQAKEDPIERVRLMEQAEWSVDGGSWLLALAQVIPAGGEAQTYATPLALAWGDVDEEAIRPLLGTTLARVRRGARLGVLCDAFSDEGYARALVQAMGAGEEVAFGEGRLRFSATSAFAEMVGELSAETPVRRIAAEQTNTSVVIGDRVILKAFRRLHEGISPELEIGRFLTESAQFDHIAPLAGAIEYLRGDGTPVTIALLQRYVSNQGDGWSYTLDYLARFLEHRLLEPAPPEPVVEALSPHGAYLVLAHRLGTRTGELHRALARGGDPAFDPEPIGEQDLTEWRRHVEADVDHSLGLLAAHLGQIPEAERPGAERLLDAADELRGSVVSVLTGPPSGHKARYHGDFHLGQVLVVENDFVIVDFEGEPARPLLERRIKHSPLRDVAGMLRSFDYAAYATLRRASAERPEDFDLLEPDARQWEREAAAAFLEGYQEAVAECPCYPEDPAQAQALIRLFTLEKALYELRYELANRPAWAGIPIRGILALLESATAAQPEGV
jgi:maltose alpha-D-glucosyltransferase / alpha-amylase